MSEAELLQLEMLLKKLKHHLKGQPRSVTDRVAHMDVAVDLARKTATAKRNMA